MKTFLFATASALVSIFPSAVSAASSTPEDTEISVDVTFDQETDIASVNYTVNLVKEVSVEPDWVVLSRVIRLESEDSEVPTLTTADLLRDAALVSEATSAELALVTPRELFMVDDEIVEKEPEIVALPDVDPEEEYDAIAMRPTAESWETDVEVVFSVTEERWNAYDPRLQDFLASQSCELVFEDLLLTIPYGDRAVEVSEVETADTCTITASFEVGEEESHILAGLTHRETATFYRDDVEAGVEFSAASENDQQAADISLAVNSGEVKTQAAATEAVKVFEVLPTTTTVAPATPASSPAAASSTAAASSSVTDTVDSNSEAGFPWLILGGVLTLASLGAVAFLVRRGHRFDIVVESNEETD